MELLTDDEKRGLQIKRDIKNLQLHETINQVRLQSVNQSGLDFS